MLSCKVYRLHSKIRNFEISHCYLVFESIRVKKIFSRDSLFFEISEISSLVVDEFFMKMNPYCSYCRMAQMKL